MCKTRPDWDEFFLKVAETYAKRGTCERLKVGAVIVKNNKQVGQGYNGSIQGHEHCSDEGVGCLLNDEGRCIRTLHAEENAILQTERHLLEGATLYCTHEPCEKCGKSIAQAGIKRIVFRHAYPNKWNKHFLKGIKIDYLPKKPIIYMDIDDVGNNLCEFLFDTHNQENHDVFHWKKSKTFMLAENEGINVSNDYFKEVLHRKGTFLNLEPRKGYVEVIKKLIDEGFDVRLLTHPQWTSPYCLQEKMEWVQKHLPFFDLDHLMMTRLKNEVAGEGKILLDDNPEHLQKWEEKGGIGIAFAEIEYSKKWDGRKVENFDEFYELVHKLAK